MLPTHRPVEIHSHCGTITQRQHRWANLEQTPGRYCDCSGYTADVLQD